MKKEKEDGGRAKFRKHSFSCLVEKDEGLFSLRREYALESAGERRLAADLEYNSGVASDLFQTALARAGQEGLESEYRAPG